MHSGGHISGEVFKYVNKACRHGEIVRSIPLVRVGEDVPKPAPSLILPTLPALPARPDITSLVTEKTEPLRFNVWAQGTLGPKTWVSFAGNSLPFGVPSWNNAEIGLSLLNDTTYHDIGLHYGRSDKTAQNEFGLLYRPNSAGHIWFKPETSLLWTEVGGKSLGRITPAFGLNILFPSLRLIPGANHSVQLTAGAHLLAGFNADPIDEFTGLQPGEPLPEIFRFGIGLRFFFDKEKGLVETNRKWGNDRIGSVYVEEIMMFYPMMGTAMLLGGAQTAFVGTHFPLLQRFHQSGIKVDTTGLSLDVNRHEKWKRELDAIENASFSDVQNFTRDAAVANDGLAVFLGTQAAQLALMDASLLASAREGNIPVWVPRISYMAKGMLGAAALAVSTAGAPHPGEVPMSGFQDRADLDRIFSARNVSSEVERSWTARFTREAASYNENLHAFAGDYEYRGLEYAGHTLLASAAMGALQDLLDVDPRSGWAVLTATLIGGGEIVGATLLSQKVGPFESLYSGGAEAYYSHHRLRSHLLLNGTAWLGFGLGNWFEQADGYFVW